MQHINNKKNILYISIFFIAVLILSLFSMQNIFSIPYISEGIRVGSSIYMFIELLILFSLIYIGLSIKDRQRGIYILLFIISMFMYLHQIFLAFFIAGIYVSLLILLGEVVLFYFRRSLKNLELLNLSRLLHDFLAGANVYIIYICILSALSLGNMRLIRLNTVLIFLLAVSIYLLLKLQGKIIYIREKRDYPKRDAFSLSLIITMVLLQIGRVNITLDYDSLHYGLRSMFILNNGKGIYEGLGLVNDVYVYPKGLEILTMPLNTYTSYSFVLAFSLIIMLLMLLTVYETVHQLSGKENTIFAVLLLTGIPAIMNMGISAKTDIITLLIQLIAVLDMIIFLKGNNLYLLWSILALIQTFIYKPTSFFFSVILLVFNILFAISLKRKISFNRKHIYFGLLPVFTIIMVIFRSILYTNHPVTSVFSNIWIKSGIPMKYPFAAINATNDTAAADFMGLFYRIKGLFISPTGDAMVHVLIASPGVIILIFILFNIVCSIIFRKRLSLLSKYIIGVFYTLLISSLFILNIIYQVDGNYFILLYSIAIIVFITFISDMNIEYKRVAFILSPAIILGVFLCTMTNWAGKTGLTDIDSLSKGYYKHRKEIEAELISQNNIRIYNYLNENSRNRVIAMANQPECFVFACNVQSYTDIVGSGGNVKIVKTLDNFKEFLDFADIDYLYVDTDFLENNARAKEIVGYMLEDESLSDIIIDGKYRLYRYK